MARIGVDELPELVRAIVRYDRAENLMRRSTTNATGASLNFDLLVVFIPVRSSRRD
jgi:hypothetical protein